MYKNEMKCLSNAVLQSCIREEFQATWGILPALRQLVEDKKIPLQTILQVNLHQCPLRGRDGKLRGKVEYALELTHAVEDDFVTYTYEFKGSSLTAEHKDYTLYRQDRDGVVEFLWLQH